MRRRPRLAYFIWDTAPDDALLDSAARGELNTPEGIERVTRRMLDDPRARDGVDEFVSEWLRFDRVMTASRERRIYPLFNRELAKSMTEESRRFIGDLVWNDRNFMEAFTAKYSFINSDLAAVYKMPPPGARLPARRVPAGIGACRAAGTGSISDPFEQARRNGANRPRPLHSRAVSLPAGAASAAGRGYQSAAG